MPTEIIRAVIETDIGQLERDFQRAQLIARDTEQKLNSETLLKLQVDLAGLQSQLAAARKILSAAKKSGDEQLIFKAQLDVNDLRSRTTEANRLLNNYKNTGDAATSRLQSKFNDVNNTIEKQGGLLKGLGAQLGRFLTVGAIIAGIQRLGTSLFSLGSDLEETQSKFDVVFGGVEDVANQAFASLADLVGRSELQLKQFGGTLGNVFKAAGFATEDALALSENLTQLAIDVASFNNVQDEQAVNAFRSALAGEREALKNLGIVINETDVKQRAYSLGLAETGAELTKQQKALATYNLLLENTTDAQGDAVRTSDSFANQLKRLRGAITDAFAGAGQDVANSSAGFLKTITSFVTNFGSAILQSAISTVSALGNVLLTFTSIISSAFQGQRDEVDQTNKKNLTIGTVLLRVLAVIRTGLLGFAAGLTAIANVGVAVFRDIGEAGITGAQVIGAALGGIVGVAANVGSAVGTNIRIGIQNAVNNAINNINKLISLVNNIPGVDIGQLGGIGGGGDFVSISGGIASEFARANALATSFSQGFGTRTTAALAGAQVAFADISGSLIQELNNIDFAAEQSRKNQTNTTSALIDDLSGLYDDYSGSAEDANKKAAGSAKKGAKEALKAQEDGLQKRAEAEIEAVKNSDRNEFAKAKKIKEILDQLEKDKKKLRDDGLEDERESVEALLELYDEVGEVGKERYETVNKEIESGQDELQKYAEGIKDIRDELEQLQVELEDINNEADIDLADRFAEINDELGNNTGFVDTIKDAATELQNLGVNQNNLINGDLLGGIAGRDQNRIAQQIADLNEQIEDTPGNAVNLSSLQSQRDALQSVSDAIQERIDLTEELGLVNQNVTSEQLAEAEERANENETERIIRERDLKLAAIQEEIDAQNALYDNEVQNFRNTLNDLQNYYNQRDIIDNAYFTLYNERLNQSLQQLDRISQLSDRLGLTPNANNVQNTDGNTNTEINIESLVTNSDNADDLIQDLIDQSNGI